MNQSDTIYALASAPGQAGVAVVRVSGPLAAVALKQLVGGLPPPRQASLRAVRAASGEVIDRAVVLWFAAPASFTGEDVAEFHLHGGRAVIAALAEALGGLGCRLAERGEFTRRAVVNGKLDLTAAEGIADLVAAETEAQRKQALRQAGGELAALYEGWRARLTRLLAHLEAQIDFADDELPADLRAQSSAEIAALAADINLHLADGRRGERLRSGLYGVIMGAPNAGKSSLLNALAQRDVAIVTPIAGTTRDVLEVPLDVGGYPVTLADTAGLREASDVVEQEGVRRALARAEAADFKLLVFAAGQGADAATLAQRDDNSIIIINKCDVQNDAVLRGLLGPQAIEVSARTGQGLPQLIAAMAQRAEALAGFSASPSLTRARHREALLETSAALARAERAGADDMRAEDVRLASRALGRITGAVGVEDLLDVIFRDFCIGK